MTHITQTVGFYVKVVAGNWRLGRTGKIIGTVNGEFLVAFGSAGYNKLDTAWYTGNEIALIGIQVH